MNSVYRLPVEPSTEESTAGANDEIQRPPDWMADVPPAEDEPATNGVALSDFYGYLPMHSYIYTPTREMWPAGSVNAKVPPVPVKDGKSIAAATWLDQHHSVEQMTWAPGLPMLIEGRLVSNGGWIERDGVTCFNLYRPATLMPGDPAQADPWLEHVQRVFGDSADHIVKWLAHRVQRPREKINHALVLGGSQGIGKDTLLEPVKYAVGPWNFNEVSPQHLLGRFNGFVKSVILRISEARDLGDVDRYAFYDHSKSYIAAPPDVLRCDEKNLREHAVFNVCGVIVTSNHLTDGIYLPGDDRRHYVAWSELSKDDFAAGYWQRLYGWYAAGGIGHVAAYLASVNLSDFDAKAPPPKTAAWHAIVDANRAPEDAEMADALEAMKNPAAVTITDICIYASDSFREWLKERRNSRQIPHRIEAAGYVAVRNDSQKDGRWKVYGQNVVIYARQELAIRDRIVAARALCERSRP